MFSPLSPYVRKVLIVAHELGVAERIALNKINTREEPERISPLNPLGKIPALVTDAGARLYDSPVICEYLDAEFGGHRLLPAHGAARWEILTRAALADGMIDAAIIVRHERARPRDKQVDDWMAWQLRKVYAGLDHWEAHVNRGGDAFDLGHVGLGCALGYMPLRLDELVGLPRWPGLRDWYERASQRESFRATVPVL